MGPKIEDLIMALDDFAEAAMSLERAWQEAGDLADDAMDGYPFPRCFEETTYDVVQWCKGAVAKLSTRGA